MGSETQCGEDKEIEVKHEEPSWADLLPMETN